MCPDYFVNDVPGRSQGRLPQECRLRGIESLEAANAFLPEWIATGHNGRFTVKAEQVGTAFLPYGGSELDTIWSHQEERIVGNDNTVSYHTRILQVPQQTFPLQSGPLPRTGL